MRSTLTTLTAAALALTLCSCGGVREERLPETGATLEGTIKYGDEPVQFAQVVVQGGGLSATGNVYEGRYKIENVPLGEVAIGVDTEAATGDFQSASMSAGAYSGPEAKGKKKVAVKFVKVPEKFATPKTSGLTTTVQAGVNTFDIVIPK